MLMIRRLQVPRLTSSSFAARSSICQFEGNGVWGFSSRKDRWMNEDKSCRRTSAYILAGEGAMLACRPFGSAQLHSLIDRPQNFKVGFAERILCRSGLGGTAFDFVDPIEKLRCRLGIAGRSLAT